MNAATPIPQPHSGSRIALRSSKALGWQGFGADLVNVSAGLHRIPALKHHRVGPCMSARRSSRALHMRATSAATRGFRRMAMRM